MTPYLYAIALTLIPTVVSFASFSYLLFGAKGEKLVVVMFPLQLLCFIGIAYGAGQILDIWARCN